MCFRVAVISWWADDEISSSIQEELQILGHETIQFRFDEEIPSNVDIVFSFAPYGKLQRLYKHLEIAKSINPQIFYIHWNTQNIPNPKMPWSIIYLISAFRSWIDRMSISENPIAKRFTEIFPINRFLQVMFRYRYVGDYYYAHQQGLLDLLVDSSKVFSDWFQLRGIPSESVPWGTQRTYYSEMGLDRDIDVIWFGKRRSRSRSQTIDMLSKQLKDRGYNMVVYDGESSPFIWGEERTNILNRTKIAVNLLISAEHDNIFAARFHVVAGNRCMIVSEPELNHCPNYIANTHYIRAEKDQLVDQIEHYLKNEDQRLLIAENAFKLATTEMCFGESIKKIMEIAAKKIQRKAS